METTLNKLQEVQVGSGETISPLEEENLNDEQREALAYAQELHAEAEALEKEAEYEKEMQEEEAEYE